MCYMYIPVATEKGINDTKTGKIRIESLHPMAVMIT